MRVLFLRVLLFRQSTANRASSSLINSLTDRSRARATGVYKWALTYTQKTYRMHHLKCTPFHSLENCCYFCHEKFHDFKKGCILFRAEMYIPFFHLNIGIYSSIVQAHKLCRRLAIGKMNTISFNVCYTFHCHVFSMYIMVIFDMFMFHYFFACLASQNEL